MCLTLGMHVSTIQASGYPPLLAVALGPNAVGIYTEEVCVQHPVVITIAHRERLNRAACTVKWDPGQLMYWTCMQGRPLDPRREALVTNVRSTECVRLAWHPLLMLLAVGWKDGACAALTYGALFNGAW